MSYITTHMIDQDRAWQVFTRSFPSQLYAGLHQSKEMKGTHGSSLINLFTFCHERNTLNRTGRLLLTTYKTPIWINSRRTKWPRRYSDLET